MRLHTQTHGCTLHPEDPVGAVARQLIEDLCREMTTRYGTPPSPFSPAESNGDRAIFLVARLEGRPVGCGALRPWDANTAEIKRMYVDPAFRRQGIARRVLLELEGHARRFNYRAIRLETGIRQPEAQQLYQSLGYHRIPTYGPYVGNVTSVCFEKSLLVSDEAPESVVQRQLDAYNARDIGALMATYAANAQQFEFPVSLLADGEAQIRERTFKRFQEPNLQARLLHRTVVGNVVIDHEEVTRTFPEGPGKLELVAIYEIREGRIASARFINGRKTIDALEH